MIKRASVLVSCFIACQPQAAVTPPTVEKPTEYEVQFRFTNLTRNTVTVQLDGEAAERSVAPLGSHHQVGLTLSATLRGKVRVYTDGGIIAPAVVDFETDVSSNPTASFVVKETTPARISTNVTVEKQSPGQSFGARVAAGLGGVDVGGGVDTGGDCNAEVGGAAAVVRLRQDNSCDDSDLPWFRRPAGVSENTTPYFIHGSDAGDLLTVWLEDPVAASHSDPDGNDLTGAALIGGALPGGAVISAAVSSLYVLDAHGSASNATVSAKTGTKNNVFYEGAHLERLVKVPPSKLTTIFDADEAAVDLRVRRSFDMVIDGTTQSFELGYTGPCRPPYLCDDFYGQDLLIVLGENMSEAQSVLKTRHETAKNSVGNVRGLVIVGTTSPVETSACVQAFAGDTTCVMGAARVKAGLEATGGALGQAASLRLFAPKFTLGALPPTLTVLEYADLAAPDTFSWKGNSPIFDPAASGYAFVASGPATGGDATKRSLFFVDTSASPWVLTSATSN